jgi:hypothetical protein
MLIPRLQFFEGGHVRRAVRELCIPETFRLSRIGSRCWSLAVAARSDRPGSSGIPASSAQWPINERDQRCATNQRCPRRGSGVHNAGLRARLRHEDPMSDRTWDRLWLKPFKGVSKCRKTAGLLPSTIGKFRIIPTIVTD